MLAFCGVSTLAQTASTAELRGRIEQIARAAQGRVGATATVLETGESVALQGDKRFPMQSVYKLPIGMTEQNRRMPGTDELHVALPHVQHYILHGNKPTEAQIALTEQTVEHLHDALGIGTMAHTGTKLSHEPGHLQRGWDAFPRHVPEEQPHPVSLEAYGII